MQHLTPKGPSLLGPKLGSSNIKKASQKHRKSTIFVECQVGAFWAEIRSGALCPLVAIFFSPTVSQELPVKMQSTCSTFAHVCNVPLWRFIRQPCLQGPQHVRVFLPYNIFPLNVYTFYFYFSSSTLGGGCGRRC